MASYFGFESPYASLKDPVSSVCHQKKKAEGKNHLTGVSDVARKMCNIIYAILKTTGLMLQSLESWLSFSGLPNSRPCYCIAFSSMSSLVLNFST